MRKFTIILMMFVSSLSFAQNAPINFEAGGHGANWTWTVFENATNPPVEIIANPDQSGGNTSATVAKFTALQTGAPWAGCESAHGATNLGPFVLNETNSTIKIMVWKSVISDVGIKLVAATGWAQPELKVPNTLINQWEELTFNFAGYLNPPASEGQLDQIVVFPDFNMAGRTQDNIVYFDNITFHPASAAPDMPSVAAPAPPVRDPADVLSIYSHAYTNVENTDFNPNWGQSTVVTFVPIAGNETIKYASFNYQGTQFANPLNASTLTTIHLDMWTSNATTVNFSLVSTGPVETPYSLAITPNQWVSYDIPLTAFGAVNLADVIQLKFDGGTGTQSLYLDNIYFYKAGAVIEQPAVAAPSPPGRAPSDVMSIYSHAYTNIAGTDFNPNWGQSTAVTFLEIGGNETMKYANFNYQGTQFASPLNVTQMETIHLDMWTSNGTTVNFWLISTGPVETPYSLPITPNQWVSYNIPLTTFTGVNMADIIQFKFDGGNGQQSIFLDNLYFYRGPVTSVPSVDENKVRVYPNPVKSGDRVTLSADVDQIEVYDAVGRKILSTTTSVINTEGLDQGIYILRIHTSNGKIQTERLFVN